MLYEFHITMSNANKEKFKNVCKNLKVKPIILDIQNKDGLKIYEEVMTSSTEKFTSDSEALGYLKKLSNHFKKDGFKIIREKIECETYHKDVNKLLKNRYLESHLNIFIKNEQNINLAKEICKTYNVHLSKNTNKIKNDGYMLMVTYRENCKLNIFKEKLDKIKYELSKFYIIEKEVIEYALYDTNLDYDKDWLKD